MASPLSIPAKSPATVSSPTSPRTSLSLSLSGSASSPPPLAPSSPPTSLPPEPDPIPPLHHAAQLNDLSFLDRYPSSSSELNVNLTDSQGITALHWASINGHVLFARRLLNLGANPDVRGGELSGTPLMWAARNGHLSIVHLLLSLSSSSSVVDPTLVDSQSFNCLHLSVHSSSPFLVAYLLFTVPKQVLRVDTTDQQGHTGLAWACYQGDAISVELLLKAGASPTRRDDSGLTPLHWAVTKGNSACIKRIVQASSTGGGGGGGDRVQELLQMRDQMGKTARDMAIELKNYESYKRALGELGRDEFGNEEDLPVKGDRNKRWTIWVGVVVGFGIGFKTLESFDNGWIGLGLMAFEAWGLHYGVTKVVLGVKGPLQSDRITKSNYLMSIISASLFWVGWVWVTRFLYQTNGYGTTNFLFGVCFFTCCYTFWRSITLDPGHVPYSPNDMHLKETIEGLVEEGKFNGMNFCLTCMVKRPLRSKHSYATGRCVGRFDHYCPWVWNDVGVNNHRQFLLFVSSLVVGVLLFIRLSIAYFSLAPESTTTTCSVLPSPVCFASHYDTFALSVTVWAGLQLSWTVILLGVQIWQVSKQVTTLEVSNLGRYGYMGGKPGISAPHQQGAIAKFQAAQQQHNNNNDHRLNSTGTSGDLDVPSSDPASLSHAPTRTSTKPSGAFGFLLKLLGLDRFTTHRRALHQHQGGGGGGGGRRRGDDDDGGQENPFDLGVTRNCLDFWTLGNQLGVSWIDPDLEIPIGGFKSRLLLSVPPRRSDGLGSERGGGGSGQQSPYERLALEEV